MSNIRKLTPFISHLAKASYVKQAIQLNKIIVSSFEPSKELSILLGGVPQNYLESIHKIYKQQCFNAYEAGAKEASALHDMFTSKEESMEWVEKNVSIPFSLLNELIDGILKQVSDFLQVEKKVEIVDQIKKDLNQAYKDAVCEYHCAQAPERPVEVAPVVVEEVEEVVVASVDKSSVLFSIKADSISSINVKIKDNKATIKELQVAKTVATAKLESATATIDGKMFKPTSFYCEHQDGQYDVVFGDLKLSHDAGSFRTALKAGDKLEFAGACVIDGDVADCKLGVEINAGFAELYNKSFIEANLPEEVAKSDQKLLALIKELLSTKEALKDNQILLASLVHYKIGRDYKDCLLAVREVFADTNEVLSTEEPMDLGRVQECIAALGYNFDDIKVLDRDTHYAVANINIKADEEEKEEAPDMLSDLEKYTKLLNDPKKEMILRYALGLPPINQMVVASAEGEAKVGPYEVNALRDLVLELAKVHTLTNGEEQLIVIESIISDMQELSSDEICNQVVARLELKDIMPEGCGIDDLSMILDELAAELTQAVDLYGELHFMEEDGRLDLVFIFETKDANKIAILNEAIVVAKIAKVKRLKKPAIGELPPSPHGLLPLNEQKEVEDLLKVRNYKKLTLAELKKIAPKAAAHIEELIKILKSGPIGVALSELTNSTDKLIKIVYGLDGLDYAGYVKDNRFATGKKKIKASDENTPITDKLDTYANFAGMEHGLEVSYEITDTNSEYTEALFKFVDKDSEGEVDDVKVQLFATGKAKFFSEGKSFNSFERALNAAGEFDYDDDSEASTIKAEFKIGDKVEVDLDGKKKIGEIKKMHDMGDMADVDFGHGDIYGIMFRRMKLIEPSDVISGTSEDVVMQVIDDNYDELHDLGNNDARLEWLMDQGDSIPAEVVKKVVNDIWKN